MMTPATIAAGVCIPRPEFKSSLAGPLGSDRRCGRGADDAERPSRRATLRLRQRSSARSLNRLCPVRNSLSSLPLLPAPGEPSLWAEGIAPSPDRHLGENSRPKRELCAIISPVWGCERGTAHLTLWQGRPPRLNDCAVGTDGRSGRGEGLKPFRVSRWAVSPRIWHVV